MWSSKLEFQRCPSFGDLFRSEKELEEKPLLPSLTPAPLTFRKHDPGPNKFLRPNDLSWQWSGARHWMIFQLYSQSWPRERKPERWEKEPHRDKRGFSFRKPGFAIPPLNPHRGPSFLDMLYARPTSPMCRVIFSFFPALFTTVSWGLIVFFLLVRRDVEDKNSRRKSTGHLNDKGLEVMLVEECIYLKN